MPPVNADGDATKAAVAHDDGLDAPIIMLNSKSGKLRHFRAIERSHDQSLRVNLSQSPWEDCRNPSPLSLISQ